MTNDLDMFEELSRGSAFFKNSLPHCTIVVTISNEDWQDWLQDMLKSESLKSWKIDIKQWGSKDLLQINGITYIKGSE